MAAPTITWKFQKKHTKVFLKLLLQESFSIRTLKTNLSSCAGSKTMRFFIPAVGTTFKLLEPWTFLLYVERRNSSLFDAFGTNVEHLVWENVEPYYGWAGGNVASQRSKFEVQVTKH